MILPFLYLTPSPGRGRGVFTQEAIPKDTVLEIAPVVVLSGEERILLDQTRLHDYIFVWGEKGDQCAMALGYVPMYNHTSPSNCEYEMEWEAELIRIRSVRDIEAGEELFINYNGNWDAKSPVWFQAQ
ncbi:MAG: SET domain-containing protein [Bacteroidota bacterium]